MDTKTPSTSLQALPSLNHQTSLMPGGTTKVLADLQTGMVNARNVLENTGQSMDGTYLCAMFYCRTANSPISLRSQDAKQGNSPPIHYPWTETNLHSSQQDVHFNSLRIAGQCLT